MNNLPPEKIGSEYDQEILQRVLEDIYGRFSNNERISSVAFEDLFNRTDRIDESIAAIESEASQSKFSELAPLPVPTGLTVFKYLNMIVAWCDPIEIFKYPHVRGFQFFGSIFQGFDALTESALVTFTGNHTGAQSTTMLTANSCASATRPSYYRQVPFYSDMNLNSCSATITNTTDSSSGTLSITCWNKLTPISICASLTGGSDNKWQDGDGYSFSVWMPRNLMGMGVFPFCVKLIPVNYVTLNPKWDRISYYVKVRTYGKDGYSDFCAEKGTSGYEAEAPTGLTVTDIVRDNGQYYYYWFGTPRVDVLVEWDEVDDADFYIVEYAEK